MEKHSLYDEAWALLYRRGTASTALLQREFRISYGNAASLIRQFEEDGVVEEFNPERPRKVLKAPRNQ